MTKYLIIPLLFISFYSLPVLGQDRKDYDKAVTMAQQADSLLRAGEVNRADSLVNSSIKLYPTLAIYEYALTKAEMSDIRGANLIMDRARVRVMAYSLKHSFIWVDLPFIGLRQCNTNYAYFGFLLKMYEVNKAYGERQWMEYALMEAGKVNFGPLNPGSYDYYVAMKQVLYVDLQVLKKNYAEAFNYIEFQSMQNPSPFTVYRDPVAKAQSLIPIFCEVGDYTRAEFQVNSLGFNPAFKNAQHSWLFYINTLLKRTEQALYHFKQLPDEFVQANINANYYVLGLLDINEKKYEQAIHKLLYSLSKRGKRGVEVYMLVEKWKLYTALGDAYAGLGLYTKAKDNYAIALLANPDHQPAKEASAKLEKDHIKETASDKSSPVISLSTPSAQKELKITTDEKTILVKGFASDPSGIRSVAINGKDVYTQPDGNFWGEVNVTDELSKITIAATDIAGNRKEEVFEIKRTATDENTAADTRNGKNYALLLAAQNYTDDKIPSLENPIGDAIKLKLILKNNYQFADSTIITLFNPTSDDVKRQLLELTNRIQPEDNLVIFYAGHGIWVEKEKKGYWMLTDSKKDEQTTWLSNKVVLDLIAKLPARHTLLITDACFSGSVFKTRGLDLGNKEEDKASLAERMKNKISRVAITSGNDTEVPDKSVFMHFLVKALSENNEKYLTAQKMFVNHIIEAVMTETKTEPRYGTLELAGHIGGDYTFEKE
jgi:tetratricopeptide (TPR) repeat protein